MIKTIECRNVNTALSEALWWLRVSGVPEVSRNGTVVVAPSPVITTYRAPTERVLFNEERNANPFFHLMEALWMLAGRNDLEWHRFFNERFKEYSDDGETIHGAYGFRWIKHFGADQILQLINLLQSEPNTRRAVLGMWDPAADLGVLSKDLPCNTHCYFDTRGGALNMTVCNRSNDLVWGAYGANVVHFSVLQEFIAAGLKVPVGVYRQFSNNFHLYTSTYSVENDALAIIDDRYARGVVEAAPLVRSGDIFLFRKDLETFLNDPSGARDYDEPFFNEVAEPMYAAWVDRKGYGGDGYQYADRIRASDWRMAAMDWIRRAELRKAQKEKAQ